MKKRFKTPFIVFSALAIFFFVAYLVSFVVLGLVRLEAFGKFFDYLGKMVSEGFVKAITFKENVYADDLTLRVINKKDSIVLISYLVAFVAALVLTIVLDRKKKAPYSFSGCLCSAPY